MLHIANTDSTAGSLKVGHVPGEVMAWNDDLYEGPVPSGLSHEELSLRRAEFLISSGWREPRDLRQEYLRRYRGEQFMLDEHKEVIGPMGWWSPDQALKQQSYGTY